MKKKKVLVLGSTASSLINFRGDFIKSLVDDGYEVYAGAGTYNDETRKAVSDYNAIPVEFFLQRTGLNPFNDLKTISELRKCIKSYDIDLVFPYTIKPVIYSSLAANSLGVPVISLITGLGFTFTSISFKSKVLQTLNEFLYKRSIRKNKVVIFQNKDDRNLFLERNILKSNQKTAVVSGSGVNLEQFKFKAFYNSTSNVTFLLTARLIKEKGIALYIEAARTLKKKYPKAEFHLIGPAQTSPSAIKTEELNSLNNEGTIIWHGQQFNILKHLTNRDVFVLPSYYREGVPRSILEALSVGLPVITTDSPGCRETVLKGENGLLIPPQNLEKLIEAMEFFIVNRNKIEDMGRNSRKYAESRFDVNLVNEDLLKIINSELR